MKKLFVLAASLLSFTYVQAQQASSTAQQTVQISLSNVLEITFIGSGTATGSTVSLPFTTVGDYATGVSSSAQQLRVRTNKSFSVTVHANATNFTYTGTANPAPTMPVTGILAIKVPSNTTGGSIAAPFSSSGYSTLTNSPQNLINNGTNGNNQNFDIQYNATPGFTYPGGNYTVDVVYTATQL